MYKINTIYNEDSYLAIKKFSDKSIDLILTDPPYGIGADTVTSGYGVSKVNNYIGDWDKQTPTKVFFDELLRVSKTLIVFGGNYFTDKLPQCNHWIVWDKVDNIKFKNPFSDCELIWTNVKNKNTVKKYTVVQQGFISDKEERVHPTQKPLRLITEMLKDYSKEGDLVVDFFSGSGTIPLACKDLGIDFIGFEIDETFYKDSINRLNGINKSGQMTIFAYE